MSSTRDQYVGFVAENTRVCREHYRLLIDVGGFPQSRPGQFIQVLCRPVDAPESEREHEWEPGVRLSLGDPDLAGPSAVLRRPFSLAGRTQIGGSARLNVIHRVVGVGTDYMAHLRVGDRVGVLGPLGNNFTLPRPNQTALLVGGGVGIPPMIYLAEALAGRAGVCFAGATTVDLLALELTDRRAVPSDSVEPIKNVTEFARHGIGTIVSTDDGSYGFRGLVTHALERYLDVNSVSAGDAIIYVCGPEGMMKAVAAIALRRGIECQVAVERAMACGMGTCQSCCIRVKKDEPASAPMPGSEWCYRLACTDGPVFPAVSLLW